LFDLERQFSAESTTLVRLQTGQSLEQRRRDIYHSHHHRVFAIAFYMIGNEMEAEQVLTHSFVRAFSSSPEPDARTIDYALIKELEKQLCFQMRGEMVDAASTDSLAKANVRRTDMEEALPDLPPMERIIFLLRDVEGYTADRIGDLVGLPTEDVRSLLLTARLRLRQRLAEITTQRRQAA
jgi:RNA polymerase sigma-70 factor, ECF subfamily